VLEAIAKPVVISGRMLRVTASIGIAGTGDAFPATAGELLRNADMAMYRAKVAGKNQVVVYEPDWHAIVLARMELEYDLAAAIEHGELEVHYQPVIALDDGRMIGTEALLRWWHPTRGAVSPTEFIPIAEQTGLIRSLGAWVLEQAVGQTKRWQDAGLTGLSVAVNVSVDQLHPGFADEIDDILRRHKFDSTKLIIEITESLLVDETVRVEGLRELRALGVTIAVDDFGTGYSALDRLRQFPVDILKIDRSFVAQIERAGNPLVTAIIALGHGLGLQVIAEGIETVGQLQFLRSHQCDSAQGFLLSRPAPAHELNQTVMSSQVQPWDHLLLTGNSSRPLDQPDADYPQLVAQAVRGDAATQAGLESTHVTRIH
jgi:EAL domain-containing protein (putative c-di-GMP-specific phosphodiesterase class I)